MRSVQILGTGQLLELQRRLRAAGHENVRSSMQRRIRRAAEPLRNDMQAGIRSLPLRAEPRRAGKRGGPSPTSRPLRATVAEAVRISVRTAGSPGARVWLDRSLLPPDLKDLPPTLLNSADGRVRHPVFDNRKRWVNQWSTPMFWDKTVRAHTPRMQAEVARVLDDVRNRLT
ncbi:hypothetical protein ABZ508_02560 [Streptomyces lavendulocolor]|uniref:HK97 gp10 family phage protein n=1 Tax=Streptomyces lavendulocolor TaxID=67316 RepID=A0ABV2VY87_9ACTN